MQSRSSLVNESLGCVPFPHPRRLTSAPAQELRVAILRELGVDQYGG